MLRHVVVAVAATVSVAACSKQAMDIQPTYVSPAQYSNYDCSQVRNEMIRVSGQANQLAGKLNEDAETDRSVTAAGVILFWPALFFLGGTKEQEAEYARLRGEYTALEQTANEKKCSMEGIKMVAPGSVTPPAENK